MKVLQINSVCGIGSTGRIATDLHKTLIEQGHESHIAFGRDEPKNCENAIRIGTNFDNYTHVVLTRLFDRHGFGSVVATKDFIHKVETLNPDIIHLHNIHGYYINIEILFDYLKRSNKPIVWTLHDCWSFTGHCAHFSYVHCIKWQEGCYDCPQKKFYPSTSFLDNSKRNYQTKKELFSSIDTMTIVTPSNWLAGLVKKSYLSDYPLQVINNGIDLEAFKPTESNFRVIYGLKNKFIILGVASIWEKRKVLECFIKLSESLKSNEVIVLVGLKEAQIKKLPANIIGFTKTNSIKELAEIYSAADVFINPSIEETFGLVTAEALAAGTPAIVFDSTPGVEIVTDGSGYVAKKSDINDVKKYIEIVRRTGKNCYSKDCVRRVREKFDKNDILNEYINLYNRIIEN